MTEGFAQCAHPACTCAAAQGEFCSDYCRAADADEVTCGCGHTDCVGTSEELGSATG